MATAVTASRVMGADERAASAQANRLLGVALVVGMTLAALVPIWATEHFPSQNGPWFLLTVHMLKEYANPSWNFAQFYEPNIHAIPHVLHEVLVFGLSYVVPLLVAEKLALTFQVILLPLSIFYFLSVVAPDKKVLGFLAFTMVHTYAFYRGYHDYTLSIPLYFFAFAWWLRHRDDPGWWATIVLALLAPLVYLAHLFVFALLAASVGWYRLIETRNLVRSVRAALRVTWPGWILLAAYLATNDRTTSWMDSSNIKFLTPHVAAEDFVRKVFFTTSETAYALAAVPWICVAWLIVRRLRDLRSVQAWLRDPLLVLVATLVAVYFVLPDQFLGWHKVNVRVPPIVLGLAIGCAGALPNWNGRLGFKAAFVTTVCTAALGVDALMTRDVIRMHRDLAELLSGIDHFEQNGILLPILTDNPVYGQIRPLTRARDYYHMAKGGANGDGVSKTITLVLMNYHTFPLQDRFPKFSPESPEESLRRIAEVYNFVLLWGDDVPTERWVEAAGFRCVHRQGRLALYRNQRMAST